MIYEIILFFIPSTPGVMLLAEHYVFVTIFSLAFALPWVDHSFFFRASQNMALARGRGGHYPQRHGADPLRPQAAHRQDSEHGRDNGVSQLDIGQRCRYHDGVTTSSLSPWRRWLP